MQVLAFDTETTGLISNHTMKLDKQPEVIEFYACLVDLSTGEIEMEVDQLIRPSQSISAEITRITSIDDAMVAEAPPFVQVQDRIRTCIEAAPVVLAHNLSFDMEVLDLEMERLGGSIFWPKTRICTVEQTVHIKGFRFSLALLHEHLFSETFPEAHRAKNDVVALVRCAIELHRLGEI